jgi:hypothetical protein
MLLLVTGAAAWSQDAHCYYVIKVTPTLVYVDGGRDAGLAVHDDLVIMRADPRTDGYTRIAAVRVLRTFDRMAIAEICSTATGQGIQPLDLVAAPGQDRPWVASAAPDSASPPARTVPGSTPSLVAPEPVPASIGGLAAEAALPAGGVQGAYVRKSVSSVESVWIQAAAVASDVELDRAFIQRMLSQYIETPRFDRNELPEGVLRSFRREVANMNAGSAHQIGRVLSATVVRAIVEVLNDPVIQQQRAQGLRSEMFAQGFANSKARSEGLTETELTTLMNSAYIYLPFIQSVRMERKGDNLTVHLKGGILWYQVLVSGAGEVSLNRVKAVSTEVLGYATEGSSETWRLGLETYSTTPVQYATYEAVQAWARNLGVKTAEIPEFRLSAPVLESQADRVSFGLGRAENVHLDNGFYVYELREADDGHARRARKGYLRVTKVGDTGREPASRSQAVRWLGSRPTVGDVLEENPRMGIDLRLRSGVYSGLRVDRDYVDGVLARDANAAWVTELALAYNLAPIIGVPQTFLDLDVGWGALLADLEQDADAFPFVMSFYGGLSKRMWRGGTSLGLSAAAGIDALSLAGKVTYPPWPASKGIDFSYTVYAPGVRLGGELERLITPNLTLALRSGYKFSMQPVLAEWKVGDASVSYRGDEVAAAYPDLDLGGVFVSAGLSYAVRQLPVNLLGVLDPLKRY